ncbi:17143_t:CDS:2 [Funneliformis caledonium]|uniref:17143_t:CDS:1 n=1 Tax=Funneliformis caledonium TaxID=1117310 RepID=A0A9N9E7I9_9GLOM|nr:17143_t:CDS:2 [Funneliformis caledonium]
MQATTTLKDAAQCKQNEQIQELAIDGNHFSNKIIGNTGRNPFASVIIDDNNTSDEVTESYVNIDRKNSSNDVS